MGDVAMTVPVIRAFSQQYPEVKITMVSRPFFKPFFATIPNVEFFAVDVKDRHKGLRGLVQLARELKQLSIDSVADLHNVLRSQVVRWLLKLSGVKVAATNKGRSEKKQLTRLDPSKNITPLEAMFERHAATFKALGFPLDLSKVVLPEPLSLSTTVLQLTGDKTSTKWIGIAPFAQYDSKVYPFNLMQKVVNLLEAHSYKVFLFGGGAQEIALLEQLQQSNINSEVVAGKLNLEEELQLISNLDVMLSMDSGNAHIAAMLGVKVVTLWGATHPYAGFLPFNQPIENSLLPDRIAYPLLPTSVYGNKKVEGYDDVMRTITPETVVAKIKSLV